MRYSVAIYTITKTDSDITLQDANTTMKVNYVCNIMRFTYMCTFHSTHKQQWEQYTTRATKRIVGAQGKYKKWDPFYRLCEGGLGRTPPGNFEILLALKCVLGASEAPFRSCIQSIQSIQCIYTCQLQSSFAVSDRKVPCTGPSSGCAEVT